MSSATHVVETCLTSLYVNLFLLVATTRTYYCMVDKIFTVLANAFSETKGAAGTSVNTRTEATCLTLIMVALWNRADHYIFIL